MIFELRIGWDSHHTYIRDFLEDFFQTQGVNANVIQTRDAIVIETDAADGGLENVLNLLGTSMPYSCFMGSTSHRFVEDAFTCKEKSPRLPLELNLGLCPSCEKKLFQSYDPMTCCEHCGPHYTQLSGLHVKPDVTLAQRMAEAAASLVEGKSVAIKTLFGWRRFSPLEEVSGDGFVMQVNPAMLGEDFVLTPDENAALLSLEKPMMLISTRSETLKKLCGNAIACQCPDEAFTHLFAYELRRLGVASLWCENARSDADVVIAFEGDVTEQKPLRLARFKERRFVVSGERAIFPSRIKSRGDTLVCAEPLAAVGSNGSHRIDRMECFDEAVSSRLNILEGSACDLTHSNTHTFTAADGAILGALASHERIGESAVAFWFEGDAVSFHYYNGTHVTTVVPPLAFEPSVLLERIRTLKEGSDRLLDNVKAQNTELYAQIELIQNENLGFFEAVSLLCDIGDGGFEALNKEALKFMGKGGTQVDCHRDENRFHPYAFLGSIISYRMAGVEPTMLAYSVFESLGDYAVDILTQLKQRSKAAHTVLCGSQIAQASLFARIDSKLAGTLTNRSFPIGRDGAVVGGIWL